jgi:hypothetical protein
LVGGERKRVPRSERDGFTLWRQELESDETCVLGSPLCGWEEEEVKDWGRDKGQG